MVKNILQDVMPPERRSIRDVPLSERRNVARVEKNLKDVDTSPVSNFNNSSNTNVVDNFILNKASNPKINWLPWMIGAGVFVVLIVGINIFSQTTITLYPKTQNLDFSVSFVGVKEGEKIENEKMIPFKLLLAESSGEQETTVVETKEMDKKASGQIIVFNNYDFSPQRLVKNTRFETPEGLIFRTPKSIVIPGKTASSPGSVVVEVFADMPGEKYDVGLKDFTIPGFKGTDRFDKFYARSKTPMVGGFSGVMKVVPESEQERVRAEIHGKLEQELKNKIYAQIPEGFVLFNDAIFITYESQPNVEAGDSVKISEKGILSAVLFDKSVLSDSVAKNVFSDLKDSRLNIENIEDMKFVILERGKFDPSSDLKFDFSLSGPGKFVWVIDKEKVKQDFAGQSKKKTYSILGTYSGIGEAEVNISPFWRRTIHKNIDDIEVNISSRPDLLNR